MHYTEDEESALTRCNSEDDVVKGLLEGWLKLSVIGLGWMGLPTACLYASKGVEVIGVDINPRVVELLNKGTNYLPSEPELDKLLKEVVGKGLLRAITDTREAARQCDIFIVVVPTLVDRSGKPDYSALEDVAKKLGEGIRKGSLIVVESTVGPGVTENVFGRVIEEVSGMNIGKDLFLAYSPIRAMAGRTLIDLVKYPRILGANDDRSFMLAKAVLSLIVEGGIIKVSNIKTAELTKLCENIYRDVNIALINQIAVLCERLGIDVYEVIEAANTQPYCHLHLPGIGVGGHCIPVNPYFLLDVADREGIDLTLVKEARRVNDSMPIHVVKLIVETLRRLRGQVERAKVAVLGITYRGNVKEHRYSPVLEVIDGLSKLGVEVVVFDPLYTKEELASIGVKGVDSLEEAVRDADCIVIGADHDEFKDLDLDLIARLARKGACIVEGRHVIKRPEDVLRRGLKLRGVGRPYYG